MKAGTVTQEDAGRDADGKVLGHASRLSPVVMDDQRARGGRGVLGRGAAITRPLELSAKEKGVQFMLNRNMDEIIRFAGAHYDKGWVRWISEPGLRLQRLTTREPSRDMLEVAIAALRAVL